MSPDSPEARLGRLETAVARLEQRTDDLATDVRTLAPLVVQMAEIKLAVSHVESEGRMAKASIDALHTRLDRDADERRQLREKAAEERRKRDEELRREDRAIREQRRRDEQMRRVMVFASVIGAIAALAAAIISAGALS